MTRRQALRLGAATTLVAALGRPGTALAGNGPVSHLRRGSYTALVAETFTVAGVAMTLADLADVAGAARDRSLAGDDDAFVLTFEGPAGVEAGIHPLHHPQLGAFSLYLGPVEDPGRTQRYEAVIDRSIKRPRDPAPPAAPARPGWATTTTAEPTLEQEHAAYVAVAEEAVELARANGEQVRLADIVPTKQQVRKLRRTRRKAKPRKAVAQRKPVRRPAAPRRAAKPARRRTVKRAPRRGTRSAKRR